MTQDATTASPWPSLARYWAPVFVWMLVISTLSGDPFSARNTHNFIDPLLRYFFPGLTPQGFLRAHAWIRKAAHFGEFFVLGWLAFIAFRRGRLPSWRLAWAASTMALVITCALLDELHQMFVPSRGPSLVDSAVDSFGGLASQVVLFLWYRMGGRAALDEPPA